MPLRAALPSPATSGRAPRGVRITALSWAWDLLTSVACPVALAVVNKALLCDAGFPHPLPLAAINAACGAAAALACDAAGYLRHTTTTTTTPPLRHRLAPPLWALLASVSFAASSATLCLSLLHNTLPAFHLFRLAATGMALCCFVGTNTNTTTTTGPTLLLMGALLAICGLPEHRRGTGDPDEEAFDPQLCYGLLSAAATAAYYVAAARQQQGRGGAAAGAARRPPSATPLLGGAALLALPAALSGGGGAAALQALRAGGGAGVLLAVSCALSVLAQVGVCFPSAGGGERQGLFRVLRSVLLIVPPVSGVLPGVGVAPLLWAGVAVSLAGVLHGALPRRGSAGAASLPASKEPPAARAPAAVPWREEAQPRVGSVPTPPAGGGRAARRPVSTDSAAARRARFSGLARHVGFGLASMQSPMARS